MRPTASFSVAEIFRFTICTFTFNRISVFLVKVRHIRISGKDFPGVFYSLGNEIPVAFLIHAGFAVDGQQDFSLEDDAPLGFMGMLRQIDVFYKMHEDDLMVAALR